MNATGTISTDRKSTYTKWAVIGPIVIIAVSVVGALNHRPAESPDFSGVIDILLGCAAGSVLAFSCCLAALYREEKSFPLTSFSYGKAVNSPPRLKQ